MWTGFLGLLQFKWDGLGTWHAIRRGSFGVVSRTIYPEEGSESVVQVVVKNLLSSSADSADFEDASPKVIVAASC